MISTSEAVINGILISPRLKKKYICINIHENPKYILFTHEYT